MLNNLLDFILYDIDADMADPARLFRGIYFSMYRNNEFGQFIFVLC